MAPVNRSVLRDDPLREARLAMQASNFREAWDALQRAPDEARQTPEWLLLAAVTNFRLGHFARCRSVALQARDGFRARGDADGEMRTDNAAAAGALALGDLTEARQGFERALALSKHLRDGFMTARCANNLGIVAYYDAQYDRALSCYRLAAATFESLGSYDELAFNWLNSAQAWREWEWLDESRDASDRAVAAAERSADPRVLGQALATRAETLIALGDLELARAQAERALELARRYDDPLAEADALRILSITARTSGNLPAALEVARQGLDIVQGIRHAWTQAEVQRDLGEVHVALGRRDEARAAFLAAAENFERLGSVSRAEAMRERAAALGGGSE
jgi:tetratricopeptide (TPR) repeat protein